LAVSVYLLTPPFTQLNTPYPATAYLKGFLNTRNISSYQSDLGIEVTDHIFCRQGLQALFAAAAANRHPETTSKLPENTSPNIERIWRLQDSYLATINAVMDFLRGNNPTLAHRIARRGMLPEAGRFDQLDDLSYAFGNMGTQDKAKHIATLYLEDLSDFIRDTVDPHFGFSRYAEKLGRSAASFDELYALLHDEPTYVDNILMELLANKLEALQPRLVAISVPFPGNLYAAFRCAQYIRQHYPKVKVAMGGGFANTELRSLSDPRVFEFFHYITLDDGEAPIEQLINHIENNSGTSSLKRTFLLQNAEVVYIENKSCADYRQGQVGTPDYSDFKLDRYISAIEIMNPMHSLWSDGRWNKLTMAHGCYWGKCTFCDTSLDYIRLYEPVSAALIVDRMEEIIAQTGQTGFHFVDEAAPPALMRAVALEIIKRKLVVSWWTNIRFEKSFTRDLCFLLKASGCMGVSGGLEVASDRLLALIDKGITVAQVARVNKHFTEAGIMVHAYLMYGFPTQTAQETIDSLEMVRQLFQAGILQSAFWHQFTMTAHSPVGLQPEKFMVSNDSPGMGRFANNDREHSDPNGADHAQFAYGLKKSLLNYMHGACLDQPLHKWFDFKTPRTSIAPDFIAKAIEDQEPNNAKANQKIIWLGPAPTLQISTKSKKGQQWEVAELVFEGLSSSTRIRVEPAAGKWLKEILPLLSVHLPKQLTRAELMKRYEEAGLKDFELFWDNKPINTLYTVGLLQV